MAGNRYPIAKKVRSKFYGSTFSPETTMSNCYEHFVYSRGQITQPSQCSYLYTYGISKPLTGHESENNQIKFIS